jgi:hypothetical protein
MAKDPRKVFVIHGRDDKLRDSIFAFLRALGLSPIEWSQAIKATGNPAPFIGEVLEAAFSEAQAAVVLLNGDDMAYLHVGLQREHDPDYEKQPTPQARPNVLFEAGMAFGRHPSQTILVQVGTIRPFSDIAGRHVVRLSNAAQQRHELANRLQVAGCKVDQSGQDWYSAGNFDVEEPKISPSLHEVQPKAVSEIEEDPDVVRVLIRIGEKPGMFTADIQDITKLNRIKAQYCIDVLKKNLTLSTNSNGLM